jgi:hypothetical protein
VKKSLLASVAALAIGGPVSAAINCGPAMIDVGDASGGVASTYVAHDPGKWVIRHTLANGMLVDRGTQYAISDYTNTTTMQWRGLLDRNPRMTMVGEVMRLKTTGQPTYNEWLYKDGQLIMHSMALCQFDKSPVTQPSVSAPATMSPAYAPIAAPASAPPVAPSLAAPAYAPVTAPAPTAPPAPLVAAQVGEDSIGILNLGNAVFAQLAVGSQPVMMQIDTGASEMTVSQNVAQAMLAKGEAETTDDEQVSLADGSNITSKRVIIHDVRVGAHALHNVPAGIVPNNAGMLLPFPVLNAIGIVTIDTASNKLIFNQPPKAVGAVADIQAKPVAAVPPATTTTAPPAVTTTPPADAPKVDAAEPFAPTAAPKSDQIGANVSPTTIAPKADAAEPPATSATPFADPAPAPPPRPWARPTQVDPEPGKLY